MMPTTRYLCPLPGCNWTYDSTPTDDEAVAAPAAPNGATFDQVVESLGYGAAERRAVRLNWIVGSHLESHPLAEWVREVQRLKSLLAAATATTPDDQEKPC